jgi:site-specific DNA-cytosine methylase
MTTFASLFTGGGGADVGAARAGYTHLWGVEMDPRIASVAELNGFATMVSDVCAVDFTALAAPCWLHMSPPCTRASQANANAEESPLDQALADACIRAVRTLRPRRISLENVWGYRTFAAFRSILAALTSEGYAVDYWHLNAADYGVPQTRKRLMLVASLDHAPRRPEPTHYDASAGHIHMLYQPWIGWYAAIEDLIPTMPDSAFAPWQMARLPEELKETMIFTNNAFDGLVTSVPAGQPWPTVVLPKSTGGWRALIIGGDNTNTAEDRPRTPRYDSEPMFTVSGSSNRDRAFIIPGGNSNNGVIRDQDEPMITLSGPQSTRATRAYVGRVVKMTPRCLARFNGLPDTYRLPDSPTLACTVLGNMHMQDVQYAAMEANP